MLLKILHALEKHYSNNKEKKWVKSKSSVWPISGKFSPPQWEICIGAILAQNTSWDNVEKALKNMEKAKTTTAKAIAAIQITKLQRIIKPAGFYKKKSKYLKNLAKFVVRYDGNFYKNITREELLSIKGIGRETADSILNYACKKPHFVVDAYTRRIFSRLGIITGNEYYEKIKKIFEEALPNEYLILQNIHALIVEHAKSICRKKPLCENCPVLNLCAHKKGFGIAKHFSKPFK